MGDLLKIDPTLVGVGCCVTVCDIDGNIVIVAVGEVDIIIGCGGYGCGCCGCVFVIVDFDANDVRVTHIVKVFTIEIAKPTPTQ